MPLVRSGATLANDDVRVCKHMLRTLDLSLERTVGMQRAQA